MDYNDFKKLPADEAIRAAARYSGFAPEDVDGVWRTESGRGMNKGPSKAGAVGDFQIMPTTQSSLEGRFGIKFDPTDFHDSLYMGAEVLRENLAHFKNKPDALRAYNGGWDKSTWGKPETAAYPEKVLGAFAASDKLPAFTKSAVREQAIADSGVVDTSAAGTAPAYDPYPADVLETGLYDVDGARLAKEQQYAGFTESVVDSMMYNTITGSLNQWSKRGEHDPLFDPTTEENRKQMEASGAYRDQGMRDYVIGAVNAEDFAHRLTQAKERTDFFRRASNTPGLAGAANTLGMFGGSMLDPVGIGLTLGVGAAVGVARSAAAVGRVSRMAQAGAAGAAENAAVGLMIEQGNNQRLSWAQISGDAVMGAALGSLGGLMVRSDGRLVNNPSVQVDASFQPLLTAGARAVQDVADSAVQRAYEFGMTSDPVVHADPWTGTMGTNASDLIGPEISTVGRKPIVRRESEDGRVTYENVPTAQHLYPTNAFNPGLGYKPEATLVSELYRDLHNRGVVTELRTAKDLAAISEYVRRADEPIPSDAKAVYIPEDDKVYVFRDRLTEAEAKDPTGLIMHEVGVHYGLQRTIGPENYNRVLGSLAKSKDPKVAEAIRAVPSDTPEHLKLEETLGYLVEKHPQTGVVKQSVAEVRNWLREHVPMFRGMDVSVADAIAYVKGSVAHARQAGNRTEVPQDRSARYSRSGSRVVSDIPLSEREKKIVSSLDGVEDIAKNPKAQAQIRRLQALLDNRPEWLKKGSYWAMSPGVEMSASPNVLARKAGSLLFENAAGSAGRPKDGNVSLHFEQLLRGYRDQTLLSIRDNLVPLMTTKERAMHMLGGTSGMKRLSTEVAEERLRHRMAVQQKRKHVSSAPEGIQKMAKALDDQMFKMVDDGRGFGATYANDVFGSGVVGFMPQVWNWRNFHNAQTTSPKSWDALRKNFTQQYIEKQIDPVMSKMVDEGIDPMEMDAVRTRLLQQVEHQVNTRMTESVRDPNSRTSGDTGKFESMAAELLQENFQGSKLTAKSIDDFKRLLADHINDRSRTEFDLLREVDGVRLLDYVDHDVITTVSNTAHKFAGQNAMAKVGFKDISDFEALITTLTKTGARPIDVDYVRFAGRIYGFHPIISGDNIALAALRNFTFSAMMGKLGIAQVADISATVSALGVKSLPKILGRMTQKESELIKQLAHRFGTGLVGQDHRIQAYIADVLPNGRAMGGMGQSILKASQRSAQMVSWISGANTVTSLTHKAFLPIMTEELVRASRGIDGGMTPARLADAGLSPATLDRIKVQLDKYEGNRKEGDAFNWDAWDDQWAADRFVDAIHRVTGQTFQRTFTGEAAPWRSESAMGGLIGQFHNFGLTSVEKQLARNVSINDMNTYTSMSMGMAWSAMLYYGRLQLNTSGMDSEEAREYMERNTTPTRMANGMLSYFNMSGVMSEALGLGEIIFGGTAYRPDTGIASLGFVSNVTKAANSLGGLVTGETEVRDALKSAVRIAPGGNSIMGTYFNNWVDE